MMKIDIKDLLDIKNLQILVDKMYMATEIPFALIDFDGNILVGAGWQPLCVSFHRANPQTEKFCIESDKSIDSRLQKQEKFVLYKCPLGLMDAATPLIIDGNHVGNVFTGQFLFKEPDNTLFEEQAKKYNFDQKKYLTALKNIPIFTKEQVIRNLEFLVEFTKHLTELTLKNIEIQKNQIEISQMKFSIEYASFPIIWLNLKAEIVYANKMASKILEYSNSELIGMKIFLINHQLNEKNWKTHLSHYRKYKSIQFESVHHTKSNRQIPVQITGNLMHIGEEEYIIGYIYDISEKQEKERQLIQSEQRFRNLIEKTPYAIWVATKENKVEYINPEFTKLFGYSLEEVTPLDKWFALSYPNEENRKRAQKFYAMDIEKGEEILADPRIFSVNTKDSGQKLIAFRLIPMEDGKFYTLFEDITDRDRLESEKIRAQKIESLSLLAGGIAHDFNNLLVGILGNINLLQLESSNPAQKDLLKDLENATLRASDLTKQLLTFSKGGTPIRKIQSLETILMESLKFIMRSSNLRYNVEIADNLPNVYVDASQISQVFNNLIINSIQSMPSGGEINVNVKLINKDEIYDKKLEAFQYIKVEIIDEGEGIPKALQKNIFQPYFSTKPDGNGLGLATVYSIMKKHDGYITFTSEEGQGTHFSLFFPVINEKPAKLEQSPKIFSQIQKKVLVMDDDAIIRKTLKKMLEKLGCSVVVTKDGEETLRIIEEYESQGDPFNLIILDLIIPGGMGGKETVQKLRIIKPHLKIIVSSGYSQDPVLAKYKEYGFDARLNKPFRMEELSHTIKEVFAQL